MPHLKDLHVIRGVNNPVYPAVIAKAARTVTLVSSHRIDVQVPGHGKLLLQVYWTLQ